MDTAVGAVRYAFIMNSCVMVCENEYVMGCVVILNVHLPLNQPTPEPNVDHRCEPNARPVDVVVQQGL